MLSVHAFVHASVMLFLRYLWYALMYFHQTFLITASWDKDELIRLWGQKVKGQGHIMTKYPKIPFLEFVSAISPVCIDGFSLNFCF